MANSDALSGLDKAVKANFAEREFERVSDLDNGRDEVISGVGEKRADGEPRRNPHLGKNVLVGDRCQNRRGDRTGIQTSKKEKKRLRPEMAGREMERRRAARSMEGALRFDERLGGVDSIFPGGWVGGLRASFAVAMRCATGRSLRTGVRRGGEQPEVNDQSATELNSIRPAVVASLLVTGEAQVTLGHLQGRPRKRGPVSLALKNPEMCPDNGGWLETE